MAPAVGAIRSEAMVPDNHRAGIRAGQTMQAQASRESGRSLQTVVVVTVKQCVVERTAAQVPERGTPVAGETGWYRPHDQPSCEQ
jgi:hypothetical protein